MFMEKSYYKILDEIESAGFVAYIVGGYVRDKILGVITADIDIITNATPKDLNGIFKNIKKTYLDYGAVKLYIDNHIIDITTFRREFDYKNNKPSRIEYISSLETDLLRRDFKMNTLVIDKEENIIDLLGGKKDIKDKIITPVKDVNVLFSEDASRMLRALRFMFTLDFTLDKSIFNYIISHKELFKTISNTKKKEEFDKILKILTKHDITSRNYILKLCPDRVHTIIPGMMVVKEIMDRLNCKELWVSRYGVREGYLCKNFLMTGSTQEVTK